MRASTLAVACLLTVPLPAFPSGPSWPIRSAVEYPPVEQVGPGGGLATVSVAVDDDASDVEIEAYGLDGMRVGDDNHLHVHADRLPAGASLDFGMRFVPGPGRSSVVVVAKARFARGAAGGPVLDFPFGVENAAQQAEHSRCVRKDPEGVLIREMGCDENAPPAAEPPAQVAQASPPGASLPMPPTVTLAEARSAPAGSTLRVVGYAVDGYRCPPCPKGAMCKPCFMPSALFLFDAPTHAPVDVTEAPPDIFVLGVPDPDKFARGRLYRFELTTTSRKDDAVDGRMIRSQRPDLEPIWADNPSATQERPAVVGPVK